MEKSRGLLRMDVVVGESRSRKFKWILASCWEGGDPPLGCFGGRDGVGGRFLLISTSAGWVGWGGQAQSKGTNYSAETLGRAAGDPPGVPHVFLGWFDYFSTSVSLGVGTGGDFSSLCLAREHNGSSRGVTTSPRCPGGQGQHKPFWATPRPKHTPSHG